MNHNQTEPNATQPAVLDLYKDLRFVIHQEGHKSLSVALDADAALGLAMQLINLAREQKAKKQ